MRDGNHEEVNDNFAKRQRFRVVQDWQRTLIVLLSIKGRQSKLKRRMIFRNLNLKRSEAAQKETRQRETI